MYFYHLSEEKYRSLERKVTSDKKLVAILDHLKKGDYQIYYHYDKASGYITYYALSKEAEVDFLCFSLSSSKDFFYNVNCSIEEKEVSYAFAYYIASLDKDCDLETLERHYKDLYSSLIKISMMNKEEIKRYEDGRKALLSLKDTLLDSYNPLEKRELRFRYSFSLNPGKQFFLRLEAGFDKYYKIQNVSLFLEKVFANGTIKLGSKEIKGEGYCLNEDDAYILKFLYKKLSFLYGSNYPSLDEANFVDFLFLLKENGDLEIDNFHYKLPVVQKVYMGLDEKGRLISSYLESKPSNYYFSNKKALVINEDDASLALLEFLSRSDASLFRFKIENADFPYEALSDEFAKYITPLLSKDVNIDARFKEKHPNSDSSINFYLDYLDSEVLDCRTVYKIGYENVSKEEFFRANEINELRYERFSNALDSLSLLEAGIIKDQNIILNVLEANFDELRKTANLYISENLSKLSKKSLSTLQINAKSNENWFSLDVTSNDYKKEELLEIFNAYKKGKKFIKLNDSFLMLDSLNEETKELLDDFSYTDFGKKLPLSEALKLNRDIYKNVSLSDKLKTMFADLASYKKESLSSLDPKILSTLREYQKDGVRWLIAHDKYNLGGILADEMGLGKTLETIAFLNGRKIDKPILIVSPKSLIYNWENEFHKFDPKRNVCVVNGNVSERDRDIWKMKQSKEDAFIISYDTLRNDFEKLSEVSFSYLFLDEGQYISNAMAKKSKAAKSLSSEHRFVLTGTPIQNNLMDLWSIFDFLHPGYFPSFKDFKAEYGGYEFADEVSENKLRAKIAPFYLKRRKNEVLKELPPKEERELFVTLGDEQRKIYESYLLAARNALKESEEEKKKDLGKNKIAVLAALTRLRQIVVDPSVFLEGAPLGEKILFLTSKIVEAIEEGHKILVFSSFVKCLFHLEATLKNHGIKVSMIYGDTSATERIALSDDFNNKEEVKVMLVSLKAGGTGLNLVGADIVYHLDPWWNIASEEQASDRAHRIGQKKKVTIYKLIAKNTIEEKVLNLQKKKKDLSEILENNEGFFHESMTDEDIEYLLM